MRNTNLGRQPVVKQKTNYFHLPFTHHFTCNMGYHIPVKFLEFFPNDRFKFNIKQLMRMLPLRKPSMSNIRARLDAYRVDFSTIWDDFEDFMRQVGNEENPIIHPYITIPSGGFAESSLADYAGIPPSTGAGVKVNALPFRAYQKCVNDYGINSNQQEEVEISTSSGEDTTTSTALRKCVWGFDRFTMAESSRQRGTDVVLPIGVTAPVSVYGNGKSLGFNDGTYDYTLATANSSNGYMIAKADNIKDIGTDMSGTTNDFRDKAYATGVNINPAKSGLIGTTDLSVATGVSLPALSMAKTVQELRQINLLAGKHFPDWQYANYGIPSSDARLQNAEWLGGFKWNFITSEVLQTSETSESSAQGTMAGHGFSAGNGVLRTGRLNSFGYIVFILTIMPEPEYQQGLDQMFLRSSQFEYPQPILSHMPMTAIKESELYLQDNTVVNASGTPVNEEDFAFEPIYDYFRYGSSKTSGAFRSSLSDWLLTRVFDGAPKMNSTFVTANPSNRIFAVQDGSDQILCDFQIDVKATRHLPALGTPIF